MKRILSRSAFVFVLLAMTATVSFAKVSRATITLVADTKVNGTVLKTGTYDFSFDDRTSQLKIVRNGKEVAKFTARTEKRDAKAKNTELHTTTDASEPTLVGIAFGGSRENVVIG